MFLFNFGTKPKPFELFFTKNRIVSRYLFLDQNPSFWGKYRWGLVVRTLACGRPSFKSLFSLIQSSLSSPIILTEGKSGFEARSPKLMPQTPRHLTCLAKTSSKPLDPCISVLLQQHILAENVPTISKKAEVLVRNGQLKTFYVHMNLFLT